MIHATKPVILVLAQSLDNVQNVKADFSIINDHVLNFVLMALYQTRILENVRLAPRAVRFVHLPNI